MEPTWFQPHGDFCSGEISNSHLSSIEQTLLWFSSRDRRHDARWLAWNESTKNIQTMLWISEVGSLSHDLQGFKHPRWWRISSINSMYTVVVTYYYHFAKANKDSDTPYLVPYLVNPREQHVYTLPPARPAVDFHDAQGLLREWMRCVRYQHKRWSHQEFLVVPFRIFVLFL